MAEEPDAADLDRAHLMARAVFALTTVSDPRPLANYVRTYGVELGPDAQVVADLLDGTWKLPTPLQARTQAILDTMNMIRASHPSEGFPSVQAMQEWVASAYLGGPEQWKTVERLELRHKRKRKP